MNKGLMIALGAAATAGLGYAGYKYFTSSSDQPAPQPALAKDTAPLAITAAIEIDQEHAVEFLIESDVAPADAAEDVQPSEADPAAEYADATAKFQDNLEGILNREIDDTVMYKDAFDLYALKMAQPEIMEKLGDSARLQVRRDGTMLTFQGDVKDSEIATYRIDADRTCVKGVEIRFKNGKRRYYRDQDKILDAMIALSMFFQNNASSSQVQQETLVEA